MKVLVLVLAVCIVSSCKAQSALTEEQKKDLKQYKKDCVTKSGVDEAVVDAVLKGGPMTREAKFDCFSSCFLEKIGFLKADGTTDENAVRMEAKASKIPTDKVDAAIAKCKNLPGKDACETGGNVMACFLQEKTFPLLN